MRLKPGDIAPEFEMQDAEGRTVRLSAYAGHPVLVCFFRYAGCPFCNLALDRLIAAVPWLAKQRVSIVTFFQSDRERVQRYILRRHAITFPAIPDPTNSVYARYGVESSVLATLQTALHLGDFFRAWGRGYPQPAVDGDFYLVPASFLIDKDLKVRIAHYGRHFSDALDFAELAAAVQE